VRIISSGSHQIGFEKLLADIDSQIEDFNEIDPDAIREAEFVQVQAILETLRGKTIKRASVEETRIVVETIEGDRYFFFGFMGSRSSETDPGP
jgi:hypothetical protein